MMPGVGVRRPPAKARAAKREASSGRPRAKEQAAPDRRSMILQAAARLFAERGFEATSVRQIADAVDLLPGSLYHHFDTKEQILHEVIREPLVRITEENVRISKLPIDPEQKLIATVIMRFHQYLQNWEVHEIILKEANFFRREGEFAYVQDLKTKSFGILEEILELGMGDGHFRPGVDVYLMIGTISRMLSSGAAWFHSGTVYAARQTDSYQLDGVIDFHLDCVLRLVRAPGRLNEPIPREAWEWFLK
jgi:AcrR family transcriptional regulator